MLKITKKTISLMLALIMAMPIILAMPYSASANAGSVYEYLNNSSSLSANDVSANNVYWDNTENAVRFDGNNSYLTITNNPLSSVTADSGFTISVDVKRGSSNGTYGRIVDFGNGQSNYFAINGGSNGNARRYCVFTKLNGSEIQYYANGQGNGTVIFRDSNFNATESANEWHNIRVVLGRAGSKGRLYYYIDGKLYYVYEVSNYVNMLDNFRNNMTTYYVGKGFYDQDGTFNGYIRNLKITTNSGENEDLFFDYTFGSDFSDSKGGEACGAWQGIGGGTYGTYGDHIYLQNAYLTASLPAAMRSDANKKNWKIDFCFNYVSGHNLASDVFAPIMSVSNNPESNSDMSSSFIVARNGKIYFKSDNLDNYIGDTGMDFTGDDNTFVANKIRTKLSFSYTDGTICVYINDVLKFSKDVSNEKSFFENIYGINICGNSSVETYMDVWDLRGYSNLNANDSFINQIKILGDAAKTYEDKMQTGTVYTNVKNAYDKYVDLNRLMDAIETHAAGVSTEVAQSRADSLVSASNNMGTWSSKTFSVPDGSANKWSSHDAHGYTVTIGNVYHNVLWSGGVSAGNPGENDYTDAVAIGYEDNTYKSGSNKNSIRPVIYRESAVLVYTGRSNDDPYMPVMFRCRGWRSGSGTWTQRHRSVYIDSNAQGMYLNSSDNWHGTDGQLNYIYTMFYHPVTNVKSTSDGSTYNDLSSGGTGVKKYCYANVLRFNGSGQFSSNQYSKTINGITWGFKYSNNNDNIQTQTATEGVRASDKSGDSSYDPANRPIYVINYKAVIDALGSAANGRAKQVASYKEGGLSTFFTNYENAENFNPASYDYSNTSAKVTECANAIGSVISNLNVSPRSNIYNDLKNELAVSADTSSTSATSDIVKGEEYTTSSFNTFKTRYSRAQAKIARLVDNGFETDLGTVLSDLQSARTGLVRRADFTSLDSTYTTVQGNYNSLNKSLYTPNSCSAFESYMSGLTYHGKNASQRADIGTSSQDAINSEATAVSGAISTYLRERANLNPFFEKYNELNELISGFNSSAAMYTESSLNALIDAMNDDDVQKYVTASEGTIANYEKNGAEEAEADGLKDDLIEAFNNLKDADQGETEGDLDLSAYQAVVESINNIDEDAYDYSAADRAKDLSTYTKTLTKTVQYNGVQIKVLKDDVSEALVNAVTSFLQSRANSHIREYKITVSGTGLSSDAGVTFSGGKTRYDSSENAYYATYGTKVNLKSDSKDAAWYMEFYSETASRNEQYQDTGKYFTAIVFGNLNVTVKTNTDGKKVTIYRVYDDNDRMPVSRMDYIDGKFTVPNASALPYYTFTGYTLENGDAIEAGDELDLEGNTVIFAHYEAAEGLPFAINIDDDGIENKTASYNESVTVQGNNDTYAWLEKIGDSNNYKSFYIGKDVTFYATESITLKPVTEEQFEAGRYRVPSINVRQSGPYIIETDGKKKVTFNGQFVTDGSYSISEYGIIIGKAAEGGSISASDVTLENVGVNEQYSVVRLKSTKDVGAHQFTMAVNGVSGNIIYKGYISYSNAGVTTTVYTDAMHENI